MSDDIELPNGPLSFVSVLRLEQVEAERDALRAEVERLEQALREYTEHQSWRCQHADKQYYLVEWPADDDCPCGFDKTMRDLGLHPDQRETA